MFSIYISKVTVYYKVLYTNCTLNGNSDQDESVFFLIILHSKI